MVLVSVHLHSAGNVQYLSVHTYIQVALFPHLFEEFPIVAFAVSDEWCKDIHSFADVLGEYHLHDAFLGIFHHLLARHVAICRSSTRVEQSEIVVYLSGSTHGRSWVLVSGLLFYADYGRETCDFLHLRPLYVAEEVSCVCRKSLDVSSLSFGKESVESQRRLARARQSGDDRQGVAWYLHVYILQVVGLSAIYLNAIFHDW